MKEGSWWSRRNWWKIGFFVALIAFELAREFAVLSSSDRPTLLVTKQIFQSGNYVTAQGRWRRTDGGDALVPTITKIECDAAVGTCREMTVTVHENNVWVPDSFDYAASFSESGVSYEKEANCARYRVTLDTKMEQGMQVRTKREDAVDSDLFQCSGFEDRMEMVLSDGFGMQYGDYELSDEHFVPLVRMIASIINALS